MKKTLKLGLTCTVVLAISSCGLIGLGGSKGNNPCDGLAIGETVPGEAGTVVKLPEDNGGVCVIGATDDIGTDGSTDNANTLCAALTVGSGEGWYAPALADLLALIPGANGPWGSTRGAFEYLVTEDTDSVGCRGSDSSAVLCGSASHTVTDSTGAPKADFRIWCWKNLE